MNIEVIKHNAIKIVTEDGKIIYIDPFKFENEKLEFADIIFITHSHYDHFSPEDIEKIKNENSKIIVTKDLKEKAIDCGFDEENVLTVLPNKEYEFCGLKFKTIPAYNINKQFHKREYDWVGYLLEIEDEVVYIAGDTDATEDALNVKCDIALVPVGGTFTMDAKEAAKLIENILPTKYAIPTHYKTLVGSEEDALEFKRLLEGKVEVKILMK